MESQILCSGRYQNPNSSELRRVELSRVTTPLTVKGASNPPYRLPFRINFINSSLVFALCLNLPSIQLVVVTAVVFSTPLITIQRCLLSTTTATPCGRRTSLNASATCFVSRSWTWSRRANISAILASLESPRTFPFGMYPMCILPRNGTRWCSQREWISTSRTMTISSWSSWKVAPPTMSRMFCSYPLVK